jgi:hypothetical protein
MLRRRAPTGVAGADDHRNNSREGGPEALRKTLEAFYKDRAPQAFKIYAADGACSDTYPPHGDKNAQWETDLHVVCWRWCSSKR